MKVDPSTEILAGRYELGAVIGQGGMGVVRRGVDLRLGRDVAVKLLRQDLAAPADVRHRFEDEARAAARLSHPAAVTVFDSGEDGDVAYLVMECLSGRTLADELADGPLPLDRVHGLAVDMLGALQVAHGLGILHRDVKPSNVLIADDGRPKLADFGIAKMTEGVDLTMAGQIIGTPAYLAPERLAGGEATPGTDLYSLGVMLYESACGEKPFRSDTPIALVHAHQTSTPAPIATRRPGIDPRLASTIDRAMARQPSDRFASASEMLDALRSSAPPSVTQTVQADVDATVALAPAPTAVIGAAPPTPAGPGRARLDQRRWVVPAAAAAAVVLLLILAIALMARSGSPPAATPPAGQNPASLLPQPLDDAIRRLEDSVQP